MLNIYNSFVYVWINTRNNKKYIGSHFGSMNDGYIGSGKYFKRAYKKEPEYFLRLILERCWCNDTNELRQNYEQKWLDTIDFNSGEFYNINNNVDGFPSGKLNPSTYNHPWIGRSHTEESKRKISESKTGTKLSESHKKKIGVKSREIQQKNKYKWIHTDKKNLKVKEEDLQKWLNDGWKLGQNETMRNNISKSGMGHKSSERQKQSAREIRQKAYIITHPDGKEENVLNLAEWCKNNKFENRIQRFYALANKKYCTNHYKGYKCRHA